MNENDDDKFDDELMARAGNLAKDIQPDRDLWPDIAQAIAAPATVLPWSRYIAQAAVVVLMVGGSSGLTYLAVTDDNRTMPLQATSLVFEPVSGSFGSQYTLGPGFQDARSVLESRLEGEMETLSPESREVVNSNLSTIRAAIAEINRALADDPDSMLLQKLLVSSYQEELTVMRKINRITSTVMFREDM